MTARQRKVKTPPIVEVVWDDAYALPTGWDRLNKRKVKAGHVASCGYLVFENAERLVITSNYDADEMHVNGGIVIPQAMIVHRRTISQGTLK